MKKRHFRNIDHNCFHEMGELEGLYVEATTQLRGLGCVIAKQRQALKISQKELSIRAGVSQCSVLNLERGSDNIALLDLCKICDALNLGLAFTPEESLPQEDYLRQIARHALN